MSKCEVCVIMKYKYKWYNDENIKVDRFNTEYYLFKFTYSNKNKKKLIIDCLIHGLCVKINIYNFMKLNI